MDSDQADDDSHAIASKEVQLKNGKTLHDKHNAAYEDVLHIVLQKLDANDQYYSSYIQQLEFGALFEIFMLIPIILYSWIGIAAMVIAYAVFFKSIFYLITSVCCLIINEMLKRTIQRDRPSMNLIAPRIFHLDGYLLLKRSKSMPSGDTAQAAIFAFTMIYTMDYLNQTHLNGYWIYYVLVSIPVVAFERIYFGKHWIGDTICGTFEALTICTIVYYTIGPYLFF